jgi:hypothetical protein
MPLRAHAANAAPSFTTQKRPLAPCWELVLGWLHPLPPAPYCFLLGFGCFLYRPLPTGFWLLAASFTARSLLLDFGCILYRPLPTTGFWLHPLPPGLL